MISKEFKIGKTLISRNTAPYIIAEAGSNHNQSFDTARKLVEVAAQSGANAVKFQLFQARELYPEGTEMYNIFKSMELSSDWLEGLKKHAQDHGLEFMASAFDRKSVDILDALGVPAFKVASSETTNMPLLAHTAKKGRPMIISTGMCDLVDVAEAVNLCVQSGNGSIALLQCGAMYPLPPELANLHVMDLLSDSFGYPVGFSDHTLGIATSVAAVARGARIIEKHFTLDKTSKGPDHFYALNPDELSLFVKSCQEAFIALGQRTKEMLPEEKRLGRREGVYLKRDLAKGAKITADDLILRRPAVGIRARNKDIVVGATLTKNQSADTALDWSSIEL